MSTLPELFSDEDQLLLKIEEMEGEIFPALEAAAKENQAALTDKIESYFRAEKFFESKEMGCKEISDHYALSAKRFKNIRERIRSSLLYFMTVFQKTAVDGHTIRYRVLENDPKIEYKFTDKTKLPERWLKRKEVLDLDKEAILRDYESSLKLEVLEFFKIEESRSIKRYSRVGDKHDAAKIDRSNSPDNS